MPVKIKAWNHNTYYHRALLRLVPAHVERGLDVGCGDGTFARRLASVCRQVTAMDADQEQVEFSRLTCAGLDNVEIRQGDVMSMDLEQEAFDLVTALAVVHHLPLESGLGKLRSLVRPGGRLLVLGVWTDDATTGDRLRNHAAGTTNRLLQRAWGPDRMEAPSIGPEVTLREVRGRVADVLPGASVRRRLLWRYVLVWDKPLGSRTVGRAAGRPG